MEAYTRFLSMLFYAAKREKSHDDIPPSDDILVDRVEEKSGVELTDEEKQITIAFLKSLPRE